MLYVNIPPQKNTLRGGGCRINYFILFFKTPYSGKPAATQLRVSPIKTVKAKYQSAPGVAYTHLKTKGKIRVLVTTGEKRAIMGHLRKSRTPTAPSTVASVPKITSQKAQPVKRLESRQPMLTPKIAAGSKRHSTLSASDRRSWITPLAKPKAEQIQVRTK